MTEISDNKVSLPPAIERFVLHWGEMGAVWGVNRSVGQIHALLYLSDKPLTADDVTSALGLARSNVSTSLKELQTWNLIRRVHVMGDRRDHFEAEADLWEMVTRIAEGRKARELDPTLEMLRVCEQEANADRFLSATAKQRIAAMRGFVEMVETWSSDIRRLPRGKLQGLIRLGGAIARFLPNRGAAKAPAPFREPTPDDRPDTDTTKPNPPR
jgi:DNA-binding transcriptional regulator GbsR (MarR family)